jgi:hypothetical protein
MDDEIVDLGSGSDPVESRNNWRSEPREQDHLVFITSTGPVSETKSDAVSRRKVKVQARRYSLRKSLQASPTVSSAQLPGTGASQDHDKRAQTSRFKLSSWTRKPPSNWIVHHRTQDEQIPSVNDHSSGISPLVAELPPVNVLPIPLTPAAQTVLNFCKCKFMAHVFVPLQ